jgi:hypothetical protein
MGELVNLSLVLTSPATLCALVRKLATPGQIVVASLSTTFTAVAVAFWKTSHCLSDRHMTTGCQLKQNVLSRASSFHLHIIYPLGEKL